MNRIEPRKPDNVVEWFKVAGIICGGMIAAGTVLGFVWKTVYGQMVTLPVQAAVAQEKAERIQGDATTQASLALMDAKLDEIHRLLTIGRRTHREVR